MHHRRPSSGVSASLVALAGVVVLFAAGTALFWITGGRWMSVATPSMAQAAPVGTLVLSRPTTVTGVAVGDLIVFEPPGAGADTYMHRITRIDPDGGLHTRGDLNGSEDPWTIREPDLVGRVIVVAPGVGWILQLLPLLLVGGFTVGYLVRSYLPRSLRAPALAVGLSVVAAVALWVVKPLVRAVTITQTVSAGTFTTELVPTGLMSLDASVAGGSSAVLAPGQLGQLSSTVPGPDGTFDVLLAPHLTPVWWVIFLALWLAPSVVCVGWAVRPDTAGTSDDVDRGGGTPSSVVEVAG